MDFRFSPEYEAFRQKLREFIGQELPADWEGGGRWPEEWDWDFTLSSPASSLTKTTIRSYCQLIGRNIL